MQEGESWVAQNQHPNYFQQIDTEQLKSEHQQISMQIERIIS